LIVDYAVLTLIDEQEKEFAEVRLEAFGLETGLNERVGLACARLLGCVRFVVVEILDEFVDWLGELFGAEDFFVVEQMSCLATRAAH